MHRNWSLLAFCFLSGCQALPPNLRTAEVGIETPNAWSATKTARAGVDHAWIDRFRDPMLTRLAEEAVANNPDLKAAASRVRVAASNAQIAGAARRPQLNAVLSGDRRKSNFIGFPDFGGFSVGGTGAQPAVISTSQTPSEPPLTSVGKPISGDVSEPGNPLLWQSFKRPKPTFALRDHPLSPKWPKLGSH